MCTKCEFKVVFFSSASFCCFFKWEPQPEPESEPKSKMEERKNREEEREEGKKHAWSWNHDHDMDVNWFFSFSLFLALSMCRLRFHLTRLSSSMNHCALLHNLWCVFSAALHANAFKRTIMMCVDCRVCVLYAMLYEMYYIVLDLSHVSCSNASEKELARAHTHTCTWAIRLCTAPHVLAGDERDSRRR